MISSGKPDWYLDILDYSTLLFTSNKHFFKHLDIEKKVCYSIYTCKVARDILHV
jgi:hypothetical protein